MEHFVVEGGHVRVSKREDAPRNQCEFETFVSCLLAVKRMRCARGALTSCIKRICDGFSRRREMCLFAFVSLSLGMGSRGHCGKKLTRPFLRGKCVLSKMLFRDSPAPTIAFTPLLPAALVEAHRQLEEQLSFSECVSPSFVCMSALRVAQVSPLLLSEL
ncbi:hypothetical protein TGPRC2_356830 [Toxoplasma gondii TgCatPRC2]|uniref:Uncharacterized protein n=2 Tax=Toxoplasma gondii TaxID=5811 RepID=A0A151HJB0_TOXGO|nr:hypothetical protein TGARI_356830 [Toxoplasma gondii ARI]KYK69457.1 hypothetical protein TGPRC2_356830 [Toxoplasma gondii TgCatPRC2]